MNRLSLLLVLLLLVSNGLWLVLRRAPMEVGPATEVSENPPPRGVPDPAGREEAGSPPVVPAALNPKHLGSAERDRSEAMRKEWTEAVLQEEERERRDEALLRMEQALVGGDPVTAKAALQTMPWIAGVEFDRRIFRHRVESYLGDPNPDLRRAAVAAMTVFALEPRDVERFLPLVRDPDRDVRKALPPTLSKTARGEIEGPVAEAFAALLADPDLSVRLAVLTAIHGATRVAPIVSDAVLPLTESGEPLEALRALGALGTARDDRAVERLLAALGESDPALREEARQGLIRGVPESQGPQVVQAALAGLDEPAGLADRQGSIRLLAAYGSEEAIEPLTRLAGDGSAPELLRRAAREAIEEIHRRGSR